MKNPRLVAIVLGAAAAALAGGLLLRGCNETEEDRVRAALRSLVKAVEARDLGDTLHGISGEYRDAEGNTKDILRGLLFMYFRQHDKISVRTQGEVAVKIRPDGIAVAVFYANLAEGAVEGLMGRGDNFKFEVELKKEQDGAWRVVTHRRQAAE